MSSAEDWQRVAELDDLAPGAMLDVAIGRHLVLLVRDAEGTVRGYQGLCPHEFARLAEGVVEAEGWVRCPRHLARFRVEDGSCGKGWTLPPLRRYAVRIADGGIWLADPVAPIR